MFPVNSKHFFKGVCFLTGLLCSHCFLVVALQLYQCSYLNVHVIAVSRSVILLYEVANQKLFPAN